LLRKQQKILGSYFFLPHPVYATHKSIYRHGKQLTLNHLFSGFKVVQDRWFWCERADRTS